MIGCRVQAEGHLPLERIAAVARNRAGLLKVLGAEGVKQVKANFRDLGARPNALGAPSTGFWQSAAASTSYELDAETGNAQAAWISVSHVGVRTQYEGETISAKPGKALAIPVHPDAHGKRPGDFTNLFIVQSARAAGLARPGPVGSTADEWMFVFKQSVTIRAHPEVLPDRQHFADALTTRANAWYDRQLSQANQ